MTIHFEFYVDAVEDICQKWGICGQNCTAKEVNSAKVQCSCHEGYELMDDKFTCKPTGKCVLHKVNSTKPTGKCVLHKRSIRPKSSAPVTKVMNSWMTNSPANLLVSVYYKRSTRPNLLVSVYYTRGQFGQSPVLLSRRL